MPPEDNKLVPYITWAQTIRMYLEFTNSVDGDYIVPGKCLWALIAQASENDHTMISHGRHMENLPKPQTVIIDRWVLSQKWVLAWGQKENSPEDQQQKSYLRVYYYFSFPCLHGGLTY